METFSQSVSLYFLLFSLGSVFTHHPARKTCGILYSGKSFNGKTFTFEHSEISPNLKSDYRISYDGWDTTGSQAVSAQCELTLCSDSRLQGTCQTLKQGRTVGLSGMNVTSAKCSCFQSCDCNHVRVTPTTCARAYLEDSCKRCGAPYTDLSGEKSHVSADLVDAVTGIWLPDHTCRLSIYEHANFTGKRIDFEGKKVVENFKGKMSSFKCACGEYKASPKQTRSALYPKMINVPPELHQVVKLKQDKQYENHAGLISAVMSLTSNRGRSSSNAYILVLGSIGSGKSSTINMLFDNPNIAKVNDSEANPTVSEIQIPTPVDELGILNSELRVIDTPGFGSQANLTQHARLLASLTNFLTNHSDLSSRIPNVVLIVHKFNDENPGYGSDFVQMLRSLDSIRDRITDDKFPNVVFVFTNICSENVETQQNPEEKLLQFRKIIENFTKFPKPILVSLAENRPDVHNLHNLNGFYELPNKEYYPKNLFDHLEAITSNARDSIGKAVIRTAFRDSAYLKVSSTIPHSLVPIADSQVSEYTTHLQRSFPTDLNTTVGKLLEQANGTMPLDLSAKFPESLPALQVKLHGLNIHEPGNVPTTPNDIVRLLQQLNRDEATLFLLQTGLNVMAPHFPENIRAAHCYHVMHDQSLSSTPFNTSRFTTSSSGYALPDIAACEKQRSVEKIFQLFADKDKYVEKRLRALGISELTLRPENFYGVPRPGFNLQNTSFGIGLSTVTAVREIRMFKISLNTSSPLSDSFQQAVRNLGRFNSTDLESTTRWTRFFEEYGTHVVESAHAGGSIEITFTSAEEFDSTLTSVVSDLLNFAEDTMYLSASAGSNLQLMERSNHTLVFHGGNSEYYFSNFSSLSAENVTLLLKEWKNSLLLNPVMLESDMQLIPISQVAIPLGVEYSKEIERVARELLNATLKYKPLKRFRGVPLDRASTPNVFGLARDLDKSNKRVGIIMGDIDTLAKRNYKRNVDLQKAKEEHAKRVNGEEDRYNKWAQRRRLDVQKEIEREKNRMDANVASFNKEYTMKVDTINRNCENEMKTTIKGTQDKIRALSCLKEGTKILMADWTEKSVEQLQVGVRILDMDLKPTKVLGVTYEFLLDQHFHGFAESNQFFTDSHLFVGPRKHDEGKGVGVGITLYAKSVSRLVEENPLMEKLHVVDMDDCGTDIFHLSRGNKSVMSTSVQVYQDYFSHPVDTKVYFLQVDSPTGTYFANGYVCRHEVPPLLAWPNTMAALVKLMSSPIYKNVTQFPYTLESVTLIASIASRIASRVDQVFPPDVDDLEEGELLELSGDQVNHLIGALYSHPTYASLGVSTYAKVGAIVAPYLDGDYMPNTVQNIAKLQHFLCSTIEKEMEPMFNLMIDFYEAKQLTF